MDKPQIICHSEVSANYSVYDTRWIPVSAKFVAIGSKPRGTGVIQLYEINDSKPNLISESEKPKAFKCCTFGASNLTERHLATGDFEGKLQVWNLDNMSSPIYTATGHKDLINCIDGIGGMSIGSGAPEIVTGGRDGCVNVWDIRQEHKPVAKIEPSEGETRRDCWCVSFGNSYNSEERVICAGYDNGDLKIVNLRNMEIQYETNLKNGVCSVEFDRKDIPLNKLVATTLESRFHVFDLKVLHPEHGYSSLKEKAHKSTIWAVRHLPQNREVFITTGGDGSACLWKYKYPEKRIENNRCTMGVVEQLQNSMVSSQPVSSWDWSPDKQGLAVCSAFDQTVRVLIVTKLNVV